MSGRCGANFTSTSLPYQQLLKGLQEGFQISSKMLHLCRDCSWPSGIPTCSNHINDVEWDDLGIIDQGVRMAPKNRFGPGHFFKHISHIIQIIHPLVMANQPPPFYIPRNLPFLFSPRKYVFFLTAGLKWNPGGLVTWSQPLAFFFAFKADARTCLWGEGSRGDGDGWEDFEGVFRWFLFPRFITIGRFLKGRGKSFFFLFGKRSLFF